MTARPVLAGGALAGFLAVALGAFGAHALAGQLEGRGGALWHTAEGYQFVHALALLAVGLLWERLPRGGVMAAALLFAAGIVLFCGSLYALALGAAQGFGYVTPVGGAAFLAGWASLAGAALKRASGPPAI